MASPRTLESHLAGVVASEKYSSLRDSVLPLLIASIANIAKTLRTSYQVSQVGNANAFGDDQLNVDVLAEQHVRDAIDLCPAIVTASSEEDPVERSRANTPTGDSDQSREEYTLAFDPLDGSSIISSDWTVGTIIGIWSSRTTLKENPAKKQIAAILGVIGPRTTAIVALRLPGHEPTCFEVAISGTQPGDATVVRSDIKFAEPPFKTRYFAPANLRAAAEDPKYFDLVNRYIKEKYTLRYSGGLVPDIVHALVKGHGIYISPVTGVSKPKLRRLYELYPIALIVECAGGRAIDPQDGSDVLARMVLTTEEKAGLICGTKEEVEVVRKALIS